MFFESPISTTNSINIFPKNISDKWLNSKDITSFSKGELILKPNSDLDYIYIILEGHANIFNIHKDGKECVISILSRGDFIHLANIFTDKNNSIISKALDDVVVAKVKKSEIVETVINNPEISHKFLESFSNKINELTEILSQVAYGKVEERLIFLLKKLAFDPDKIHQWSAIDVNITHQDLASMVGSTRETVTSIINKLIDNSLLKIKDNKLWVFLE